MLNTIDLQPFTSGTAVNDPAFLQGDDGWVVKGGLLKLLPYVKPWFSDLSVYNTNGSWGDVTYQASVRSVKGTPGGLLFRANAQNKTGYYVMLDPTRANPNGDSTVSSLKLYKNGTSLIGSAPTSLTLAANTFYTVQVVTSGSSIKVFVNGSLEITATDSSYASGQTGVRLESNTGGTGDFVEVDNVTVSSAAARSTPAPSRRGRTRPAGSARGHWSSRRLPHGRRSTIPGSGRRRWHMVGGQRHLDLHQRPQRCRAGSRRRRGGGLAHGGTDDQPKLHVRQPVPLHQRRHAEGWACSSGRRTRTTSTR